LKYNSALRSAVSLLVENLPAVDNPAPIFVRPSFPQIIHICFFAPFDQGALTAIINEGHQTVRTAHLIFSHFSILPVKSMLSGKTSILAHPDSAFRMDHHVYWLIRK